MATIKELPPVGEIYIELKEPSAYFKKYWINRLISKFSLRLANSQYSIHTDLLKVKQGDLLKFLNKCLIIEEQK